MSWSKAIKKLEKELGYKLNTFEREFAIYWFESGYDGNPDFNSELAMDFQAMLNENR